MLTKTHSIKLHEYHSDNPDYNNPIIEGLIILARFEATIDPGYMGPDFIVTTKSDVSDSDAICLRQFGWRFDGYAWIYPIKDGK